MIRFNQVYKRYPGSRDALAGVDLNVETGEMVFLTGHSGAGKSTMLKLIGLLERPTPWWCRRAPSSSSSSSWPLHRRRHHHDGGADVAHGGDAP